MVERLLAVENIEEAVQEHFKKYYGSILDPREKKPPKKPAPGSVRMNFKKKPAKAEEQPAEAKPAPAPVPAPKKGAKPKDGSYLERLNSKLEVSSRKEVPKVAVKSERQPVAVAKTEPSYTRSQIVSVKKSNIVVPAVKTQKQVDLRIESLRTVMKPPQTILSMIEDEYSDIVSHENVIISTRSIRASKQGSFAESMRSDLGRRSPPIKQTTGNSSGLLAPSSHEGVKANGSGGSPRNRLVEELNTKSREQKVRMSEPTKFLRFSEFDNTNSDELKRPTPTADHRLTFKGTPRSDMKFENKIKQPSPPKPPSPNSDEHTDQPDEPTDFVDIFTPKGTREPVESIKRQEDFEPDMFVKKVASKENMLESLQQAEFLKRKGEKVMDTQAMFESEPILESEQYIGSNVFVDPNVYVPKTFDNPVSAKFNNDFAGEYATSDFNIGQQAESEKELLLNINNLITWTGKEEEVEGFRHKRPLHSSSFNKSEQEPEDDAEAVAEENANQPEPERMKRVITFANVHKLAKPSPEDEEFIRNYYANKDYPKAVTDDEEGENAEVSRDSLDVHAPAQRNNDEGVYSVKSDRFHEDVGESRSVRFQSVTTSKQQADNRSSSGMVSASPVQPVNVKTSNAINFSQWEMNYVSKDTQEIDNNLLAEINAIYKNTVKITEEPEESADSDNEKFNKDNRNMFLVASKDGSFDEEDKASPFDIIPESQYFTLGNMVVQNSNVQTVDALTAQLEVKPSVFARGSSGSEQPLEDNKPQAVEYSSKSLDKKEDSKDDIKEPSEREITPKKQDSKDFDEKFNDLIVRMLNKKAVIIQRFWRSTRQEKPRDMGLADLFREFVKIKRRNENFVRKNCDMKGVQTSNYSIKIIQKEFTAYLDEVLEEAPNGAELSQLVGDLGLLLKKLGISSS